MLHQELWNVSYLLSFIIDSSPKTKISILGGLVFVVLTACYNYASACVPNYKGKAEGGEGATAKSATGLLFGVIFVNQNLACEQGP